MSKCVTCVALQDGTCLVQGCKPTSDCGSYRPLPHAEVRELMAENAELRGFVSQLLEYVDPAGYQDMCNAECPAREMCTGKAMCAFPDWAVQVAKGLGIEVEE